MKNRQLRITSHRFGFGVLVSSLLLLVASVTSCSKENLPYGKYPMTFTASVAEETATRAISSETLVGKHVSVYREGSGLAIYTADKDGRLNQGRVAGCWFWESDRTETITAWYPPNYQQRPTSFTVSADQSNLQNYESSDMIYIPKQKIKFDDRHNKIYFMHLPAKVKINLIKGDGVDDSDLKSATVTIESQATEGNLDDNWTVTPGTGSESVKPRDVTSGLKRTFEALLVPQQMKGKKFIKITTGVDVYSYTPQNDSDANLLSGKCHEYNVTIKKGGIIVVKKSTIGSWTGSGSSNIESR